VASGVQVDANVVLRLPRADRPHGRHVLRLGLDRQARATIAGAQLHPAGLILLYFPAQQIAIEVRQRACIGRVKDHPDNTSLGV
jgi:hypothetical protein